MCYRYVIYKFGIKLKRTYNIEQMVLLITMLMNMLRYNQLSKPYCIIQYLLNQVTSYFSKCTVYTLLYYTQHTKYFTDI